MMLSEEDVSLPPAGRQEDEVGPSWVRGLLTVRPVRPQDTRRQGCH